MAERDNESWKGVVKYPIAFFVAATRDVFKNIQNLKSYAKIRDVEFFCWINLSTSEKRRGKSNMAYLGHAKYSYVQ